MQICPTSNMAILIFDLSLLGFFKQKKIETPYYTCHVSHVTCHIPLITCHILRVTCHMSYTAIPRCHWQYWIRLEQNKEELIIPPFTEDEFTRILAVAQW